MYPCLLFWNIRNIGLCIFANFIVDGAQVNGFLNAINPMRWLLTNKVENSDQNCTLLITTPLEKFTITIIHLCFILLGDENDLDFRSANH